MTKRTSEQALRDDLAAAEKALAKAKAKYGTAHARTEAAAAGSITAQRDVDVATGQRDRLALALQALTDQGTLGLDAEDAEVDAEPVGK